MNRNKEIIPDHDQISEPQPWNREAVDAKFQAGILRKMYQLYRAQTKS